MRAAAYLRSTKDRADMSPAAQLHALQEIAKPRGLKIVETYEDAVQKGSTEHRPAFQRLVADIKRKDRGWDHLLIHDTSRLARGRYIAQTFKHQCKRHGVTVIFGNLPDMDPISAVILESVLEAMDEVHSMMSRDKGLAGMAENVRRGFRAGGRAPWGYRLERHQTGSVRDGQPVTKSRLAPNADAPKVTAYLEARAAGVPRAQAAATTGRPVNSLVDAEWNALTYAGDTVWNRHRDKKQRGIGLPKMRPRSEWQVTPDTHPALITRAQAEAILAQLETSDVSAAISAARRAQSDYLLTEVLVAPDGCRWKGSRGYYCLVRGRGISSRWVKADSIDRAVLGRIRADFREPAMIDQLLAGLKAMQPAPAAPRAEIARLTRQKERAARLALEDDGGTFVGLVASLSRQIEALEREALAIERQGLADDGLAGLTRAQVQELLLSLDDDRALVAAVQEVVLDPATLQGTLSYRLSLASPRRSGRWNTPAVPGGVFKVLAA